MNRGTKLSKHCIGFNNVPLVVDSYKFRCYNPEPQQVFEVKTTDRKFSGNKSITECLKRSGCYLQD